MEDEKIRSESEFIWKTIGKILLTPIYFVMFLFNKKTFSDLIEPFTDFFKFVMAAASSAIVLIATAFNALLFFKAQFIF